MLWQWTIHEVKLSKKCHVTVMELSYLLLILNYYLMEQTWQSALNLVKSWAIMMYGEGIGQECLLLILCWAHNNLIHNYTSAPTLYVWVNFMQPWLPYCAGYVWVCRLNYLYEVHYTHTQHWFSVIRCWDMAGWCKLQLFIWYDPAGLCSQRHWGSQLCPLSGRSPGVQP